MKNLRAVKGRSWILTFAIIGASFWGCEEELEINAPGNLVPRTADQDSSLPSIQVNGTILHAEVFGSSTDPMVIYLHGGPGGDYRNSLSATQLADDGYFVVFYDQRGAGLSKRHSYNSYSIQQYLDDLASVIEHYRTSDTQKVFLFGHSWGAMLAAAYINEYPDEIDGAILAEPGGLTDELAKEYSQSIRKLRLLDEATNDATYYEQFITGNRNDHQILDYRLGLAYAYTIAEGNDEGIEGPSPFWRMGAVIFNRFMDIANEEGFDFTTNLDQYNKKVLVLYGENNKAYGLRNAEKEAAFFNDADIVQIDDTGHEMIYFKWERVHPVVYDYLEALK